MQVTEHHEIRAKLAALEASVNGAASLLNDQRHSRLGLVGEGLMTTFYDFVQQLEKVPVLKVELN
jgi:hypothetical protein